VDPEDFWLRLLESRGKSEIPYKIPCFVRIFYIFGGFLACAAGNSPESAKIMVFLMEFYFCYETLLSKGKSTQSLLKCGE